MQNIAGFDIEWIVKISKTYIIISNIVRNFVFSVFVFCNFDFLFAAIQNGEISWFYNIENKMFVKFVGPVRCCLTKSTRNKSIASFQTCYWSELIDYTGSELAKQILH